MNSFEDQVAETRKWFESPRFTGITRLYSARQVVEQRGTIPTSYPVAKAAAEGFTPA
jgi:isocitrate lyase